MKDNQNRQSAAVDRRGFLSRLACGAAAGVVGPGLLGTASASESKWKMRLSTSSIHYKTLPIEQACRRIAQLGFEGIDIWSAHAGCPHLDDVQKRLGAEGLKELLAKTKLKLYAFSVYSGGYRKYAELLCKSGGGVAVSGSAAKCDPKDLIARMKAFCEAKRRDADLAGESNSYIAVENHGHALLDSLDSFKAFVDINRHPRLGIAVAPYHLQGIKVSVEEVIAVCGKQLFFFYAWQRGSGLAQLPGQGPTDCTSWIAALAKSDYSWYVNPFMHGEPEPDEMSPALAKSRDYLLRCRANVDRR